MRNTSPYAQRGQENRCHLFNKLILIGKKNVGWIWRREVGVDAELSVNRKVLWDKGADKIQLNKPNSPDL